jgi:hypothetical protein
MEDKHEPTVEGMIERRSSEKFNFEGQEQEHRGSEARVSQEIGPAYKNEMDPERDVEKGQPSDSKMAETSSMDSPQKVGATEEIGVDEDEYEPGFVTRYWRRYRVFGHAIIWLLLTAYSLKVTSLFTIDGGFVD